MKRRQFLNLGVKGLVAMAALTIPLTLKAKEKTPNTKLAVAWIESVSEAYTVPYVTDFVLSIPAVGEGGVKNIPRGTKYCQRMDEAIIYEKHGLVTVSGVGDHHETYYKTDGSPHILRDIVLTLGVDENYRGWVWIQNDMVPEFHMLGEYTYTPVLSVPSV